MNRRQGGDDPCERAHVPGSRKAQEIRNLQRGDGDDRTAAGKMRSTTTNAPTLLNLCDRGAPHRRCQRMFENAHSSGYTHAKTFPRIKTRTLQEFDSKF